jgi:dTMP kinase
MAERIREFVAEHGSEPLPELAELLLVFAARSLHVQNVIEPALAAGTWVICDRFTDSSRAYQGGGRGLPMEHINTLADWVHHDLNPDLTILLDAPVATGMSRAGRRSAPDRWESEEFEFFARVREAYLQLAADEPERIVVVDAARTLDAVRNQIESIARSILDN